MPNKTTTHNAETILMSAIWLSPPKTFEKSSLKILKTILTIAKTMIP
jgi:hypothetical protein